jgi:ribosomal protein S18 acetylase RimI-like enzyme
MDDRRRTASLDALRDGYLGLCRLAEGQEGVSWGREPDVVWGMLPLPIAALNRIMRIQFSAEVADARIRAIADRYQTAGVAGTWWLDPESRPADLGDRLERMGLDAEELPAMRIDASDVPDLDLPAGATLSWVADPPSMRAATRLAAAGFGMPDELGDGIADLLAPVATPGSPVRTVVAELDGRPVASALGIDLGEVVAIYNVATLEEARGRGIGRAVTIAVLRDAMTRGARFGVLESSDLGHSVYRRIGFRDVAALRMYRPRSA